MRRLSENLRGILFSLTVTVVTLIGAIPLFPVGLVKLLLPFRAVRRATDPVLLGIARYWARAFNWVMLAASGATVELHNSVPADPRGRYVLISNHQCWADVMLLAHVLDREKLPFPRFFIKEQLRWLPVVGFACWVLDFPFMKRYSQEQMERNPALRGKDLETTKKSCETFREVPVTVVNFAEGTRSTAAKRAAQDSPYRLLLRPKAGGTAFTLQAMGDVLDGVLDMTVAYAGTPEPKFWDFVCGRIPHVYLKLRPLEVPEHLRGGDYQNDPDYRTRFRAWIEDHWARKNAELTAMFGESEPEYSERREAS
jgi:1-acyl-sn-glycerol-3-phosphate acyltransferase